MLINKITVGFVIQVFDTNKKDFISQTFCAGDQVDYEDEKGNPIEPIGNYLPFDMVQPE